MSLPVMTTDATMVGAMCSSARFKIRIRIICTRIIQQRNDMSERISKLQSSATMLMRLSETRMSDTMVSGSRGRCAGRKVNLS